MPTAPILYLKDVVKRFDDFTALDNINLEIFEGEFLTIVGPSGSGKTTLIRLMVGMDEPTEGTIWLRNERIDQTPANKRPTCMVFQSLALFPHRSVGQNIEFPLKIKGVSPKVRSKRALELLELLHLPKSFYNKRISQCSGGEQQRIALARALAFDPEIIFFDEPLSALDYRLRKTLEKELVDLHERTGKTFVYITHSLEEAMVMSDRIAIMNSGKFEQIDVAEVIYSKPVSRFVASFMGEVNMFDFKCDSKGDIKIDGVEIRSSVLKKDYNKFPSKNGKGALMVRPEFVRFNKAKETNDFQIRGYLKAEYELGSRIQYEVDTLDGSRVVLEKLREDRFKGKVGTRVVIGWDIKNTHLILDD
jgi:spermidine/putrescine transport system ATP-binding protein